MPELNEVVDSKKKTESTDINKKGSKKIESSSTDKKGDKKPEKKIVDATTIENEDKKEYRRPPLEQITTDFESFITSLKICDQPVIKLGYKCGKIIFGLKSDKGKDFRVIAYKARKKHKTVNGKSRCIYYFGINANNTLLAPKELFQSTKRSKFGKCSVQSDSPIELILDKITFTDIFSKSDTKVLETLKKLAQITVTEKTKILSEKKKEVKTEE